MVGVSNKRKKEDRMLNRTINEFGRPQLLLLIIKEEIRDNITDKESDIKRSKIENRLFCRFFRNINLQPHQK